ncbi:MAG: peptidylprolyl isomerase, partial [Gemmatimonadetes bacterium]|nr:peptidylprolyl isomerase [Gemmatimonadota bacterium]
MMANRNGFGIHRSTKSAMTSPSFCTGVSLGASALLSAKAHPPSGVFGAGFAREVPAAGRQPGNIPGGPLQKQEAWDAGELRRRRALARQPGQEHNGMMLRLSSPGARILAILVATALPAAASLSFVPARTATPDPVRVVVETDMGTFELDIDIDRAPVTATNFLRYVDGGHYDGGAFFRTVHAENQPNDSIRIAVVQGGRNPDAAADPFPSIPLERTSETGILHTDGAVSMARGGPDTATHSFFICIGDQPSLDFGGMR